VLLQALADGGADADTLQMIDSTIIRAHHCAAGAKGGAHRQGLGHSRGGFSTKIHLHTNAHVLPINLSLTPGKTHDSAVYGVLMKERDSDPGIMLADRGYDSDARCHPLRTHRQQLPRLCPTRREPLMDQLCPRCLGFRHRWPRRGNVRNWPSVRLFACV
jgi:hypothetical protein